MQATHRLIENNGSFQIAGQAGGLVRTTGGVFITTDRDLAEEALKFLNQPHPGMGRRKGSQRIKSMFGPL